ncbi:MAG TPA: DUF2288 domain-containing protein [Gammaproteobacteria bacterium]
MGSDELRIRLNAETGRITWPELAPHFARGAVVRVDPALDLVEVAAAFVENRRDAVEAWLQAGKVAVATDADARAWTEGGPEFRAVVAAPWVLVQQAES